MIIVQHRSSHPTKWALDCLVYAFAEEHQGEWLTQVDATGQCRAASELFAHFAYEHGIYADYVEGWAEFLVDGEWSDFPHYAVKIDDKVYDWTARQCYPGAPVPLVTNWTDWREGWNAS